MALIVGWSWANGAVADRPVGLAMRQPVAGISKVVNVPVEPSAASGKARNRVRCAECAVVESVRRIDTYPALMAVCDIGDSTRHPNDSNDLVGRRRDSVESLTETVASVTAGERGGKKVTVSTRHQIVVRFRDGSKQVFDETTPRNLQVGDRILVIAGTAAKSLAGERTASTDNPWRSVRLRTDGSDTAAETVIEANSTARRGADEL